jgi:hypothetical protein
MTDCKDSIPIYKPTNHVPERSYAVKPLAPERDALKSIVAGVGVIEPDSDIASCCDLSSNDLSSIPMYSNVVSNPNRDSADCSVRSDRSA